MASGVPDPAPRCWITGARGLIGQALRQSAPRAPHISWEILPLTRDQLDLNDSAALERLQRAAPPAAIIHCAALSRSPECQADPQRARRENVEVTRRLCDLADRIPFVFLSTDLVFDGTRGNYVETDPPHPLSVYAETKAEAELHVLRHPRHLVIRTSLNGGRSPTGDRGFNEQMLQAWQAGQILRLFHDEYRSPLPAVITARAIWELLGQGCTGLYHVAGSEHLSRWEMGQAVAARHPEVPARIERASLREFTGPPRPPDCSLDCRKAQALLSFPLPGLRQWLRDHPDAPF